MVDTNTIYGAHSALQRYAEGSATNVPLSVDGSLRVTTTMPSRYELARSGRIYVASSGTATAKAPVTAIPTTAAIFALWNGNETGVGGKSLVILGISYWHGATTTSGVGSALLAGVSPTAQSAVTTATNAVIKSTSASTRTTAATFGTDITLGGTPAWMAFGGDFAAAAAVNGAGIYVDVDGLFIVPPGYALGLHVLSPTGTSSLFGMSVAYAEVESYLV